MMHRLLRRGYRDAQLPALRIAVLSACRPRGAAPSVLGRECHLALLEGCCVPSVAADIHQALRRRPGPGHVLSTSRHGLGPEAVLPRRSLAAESRSRRWESQAQSARREREMPRPAWRPGHGQPLTRGCVHGGSGFLPALITTTPLEPRSDHVDDESGELTWPCCTTSPELTPAARLTISAQNPTYL